MSFPLPVAPSATATSSLGSILVLAGLGAPRGGCLDRLQHGVPRHRGRRPRLPPHGGRRSCSPSPPREAPHPSRSSLPRLVRLAPSGSSFMDRMNDRWDRRREGRKPPPSLLKAPAPRSRCFFFVRPRRPASRRHAARLRVPRPYGPGVASRRHAARRRVPAARPAVPAFASRRHAARLRDPLLGRPGARRHGEAASRRRPCCRISRPDRGDAVSRPCGPGSAESLPFPPPEDASTAFAAERRGRFRTRWTSGTEYTGERSPRRPLFSMAKWRVVE